MFDSEALIALAQIMFINVVLSGDNAVVIALACRSLSPRHRRQAFIWGSAGIVVLIALLTTFIVYLLRIPYVQIVGSALLLWIGVKLLIAEDEEHENVQESSTLMAAIKTIIIADFIMSLDNVLAMAGAAKGHVWMLVFGLIITIPVVLFGSALLMKIMHRFPITVILGAALIGYVAGKMMVTDPSIMEWVEARAPSLHVIAPIIGAIFVVGAGKLIEHLKPRRRRTTAGNGEAAARQSDY